MFNALQYTKSLEEKGFERDQAEILVGMFMQMIEFNMLSKSDFEKYKAESKLEFESFRVETKSEFKKVRHEMSSEFEKVRHEMSSEFDKVRLEMRHGFALVDDKINKLSLNLTIKLGVLLAISVGLLSTILAIKL